MEYGTFLAEDVVVHNSDSTGSCGSYPNGYYDAPNCRRCRDGVWWFPDYSNNMPHCCQKFGCEPGCCAYVESCCGHEPSCFPPNTQITMSDGSYNNIEDVEVGDYVLSYDEETEQQVISEVLETEQPIHYHLYTLTFENNEILKTTREHPIYVENKGWASIDPDVTLATHNLVVEQLEIGDYVLNVNNELMKLVSLEYEEIPDGIQTYNLKTISNTNTYYAEGVLVHNKDDVIDEVIDDGCDEEGQPCGTCNSGRYDSNCNCVGDGCTYSPGCSPTSELRCNNGKQERRTRGTNCCGGCSGWSGWSVSDDCPSHDAWCRGNACVDCDLDLDICNKCSGQEFYSSLYSSSNNLRCCKNFNNANEWPMDITIQWGGIACCDQSNDCPISNTDCVNNLDSDYNIERMEADTICVDGNLMSRTKLISLQLLEIAKNKGSSRYVLFCDEKNNSLNYVQEEMQK